MTKIKLNDLLSLSAEEFITHIGGIYEKSPWIVTEFYNTNLSSSLVDSAIVQSTKERITNVRILFNEIKHHITNGGIDRQLELLRNHPDLCLKLDATDDITDESLEEQGRSGLSTLTSTERTKFHELNNAYKAKFNFPFILAVRNASKYTVLSALEGRVLSSSIEEEITCALHQVDKIAWMRLLTLVDYSDGQDGHGGFLTCHVLDTANGCPAGGMRIELYKLLDNEKKKKNEGQGSSTLLLETFITNSDGRLPNGPALKGSAFSIGQYEWLFYVGDYFAKYPTSRLTGIPFLDVVPLRFGLDDPTEHYHVPLLVSPWSYSTYRGS